MIPYNSPTLGKSKSSFSKEGWSTCSELTFKSDKPICLQDIYSCGVSCNKCRTIGICFFFLFQYQEQGDKELRKKVFVVYNSGKGNKNSSQASMKMKLNRNYDRGLLYHSQNLPWKLRAMSMNFSLIVQI